MPATSRCVVIGAGLFGLAAAWALSRRGWEVEVLEAGPGVGHEWSGSKGGARIFRLGYLEVHYAGMARRAGELWSALEAESGRRLLRTTGQASVGDLASLRAVADALASIEAPAEWLAADEVRPRCGPITPDGPVLFEPESGVLAADECLAALCETSSFDVQTRSPVTAIVDGEVGITAETMDGRRLEADVVVACAGPHTLPLLGLGPAVGAPASAPQVAYFRPAGGHEEQALPVFIEWGERMVYGLPVPPSSEHAGTYKVSHHTPGPPLTRHHLVPGAPPAPDDPALLDLLRDAVARLLPTLDPEPVATERCVYDNSADGDFVLDRVGRVVVGCGSSGHGFKFGPLIGEILADLAEGRSPPVDLSPFGLDRPQGH